MYNFNPEQVIKIRKGYQDQISKRTGLCIDYWNEFILPAREFCRNGLKGLVDFLKKSPVKRYSERFPQFKYSRIKTPENRLTLDHLDKLVMELNNLSNCAVSKKNAEYVVQILEKVHGLIYGKELPIECQQILKVAMEETKESIF